MKNFIVVSFLAMVLTAHAVTPRATHKYSLPQPSVTDNYTASGNIYTATIFNQGASIGVNQFTVGLFKQQPDGTYNQVSQAALYGVPGSLYTAVSANGIAAYMQSLTGSINGSMPTGFTAQFTVPASVSVGVIVDDNSAMVAVQTWMNAGSFVSAAPPAQLVADYAGFWNAAVTPGSYVGWGGGSIWKFNNTFAIYTDLNGNTVGLMPASNLHSVAKLNAAIALAWYNAYGYTP